ncbi:MAG: hypothetical protein H7839_14075 [Magnetococcus sp. YQC-5]
MAMVITSNTLPLTTPRSSGQQETLVHNLLSRISLFNGVHTGSTPDLEKAHQCAEQMRGLSHALPCDHTSGAHHMAWSATQDSLIRPTMATRKQKTRPGTPQGSLFFTGHSAPSLSSLA